MGQSDQIGREIQPQLDAKSKGTGFDNRAVKSDLDRMTEVKLWDNPCWLAYRLNYLALRYNVPLYSWVEQTYGLSRPEYVVVYSLGLFSLAFRDGAVARDIAASSGFPQNTLSRAIHKLIRDGLIVRSADPRDRRRKVLSLTEDGRSLFDETLPRFIAFEKVMLEALSKSEQETLSRLLAKIVQSAPDWPDQIGSQDQAATLRTSQTDHDHATPSG